MSDSSPSVWATALLFACTGLVVPGSCSTPQSSDPGPRELVGSPAEAPSSPGRTSPASDNPRSGALWYRIAVSEESLEVAVRLLHPAARTTLFVPDSAHDGDRTGRALSIQKAKGPDGPLPLDQIPEEGRIDIESSGLDWVELHYRVDLEAFPDESSRPYPDAADGSILAYLPSVLVVPSKQVADDLRDIPIEIHTPDDWSLAASWNTVPERTNRSGRQVHGFVAEDIRDLRDAFFVAGRRLRMVRPKGTDLTVAFPSALDVEGGRDLRRKFAGRVRRILHAYEDRFGGIGKILVYARPSRQRGSPSVRGTAKRGGFVVRLPPRRPLRDEVELLVAHEAFHLWNGHRLVPNPESAEQTRWFKEGVTHYVALKTLRELGMFDLEDIRGELAKSAFFYRRNPASRGGRASRLDMNRLPYDRGLLLALALDGALNECSSERAPFSAWIRTLLEAEPPEYDVASLHDSYRKVAGDDCARGRRVWRRHIAGDRALETDTLFERVGLHYLEAPTLEETEVLPLEARRGRFETLFERDRESTRPHSSRRRTRTATEPTHR